MRNKDNSINKKCEQCNECVIDVLGEPCDAEIVDGECFEFQSIIEKYGESF